jgi:anti-sigma-K factor RskA
MNYNDPKLLDRLAAEYVFGSLSSRARRRFERLRQRLPAAEKAVLEWERRLMPLSGSVPTERPPGRVWNAIDERTGGAAHRLSTRPWGWWLRPAWGVAFGVLATLAVIRLFPEVMPIEAIVQERGTLPQSYVGLLTDAQNNAVLLASSTRYGRILSIKQLRPVEASGRVAVLWALPRDGAPFAVGIVPLTEKATLTLADTSEKLFFNVPRLAVSFETGLPPPGATPSPFVLTGHCVKLW